MDILGRDPLSMLNALRRVPVPFKDIELPGDRYVRGQLGEAWDVLDALGFDEMFLGSRAYDPNFIDPRTGGPAEISAGQAPIIPWGGFTHLSWNNEAPMSLFLKGGAHRMGPARSQMEELVRKEKLRELRNIYGDRELGLDAATRRVFGPTTQDVRSLPSLNPNQEKFRRYLISRREEGASQGQDIWDALMRHRDLAREMKSGIRGIPELDPNKEAFRRYLLQKRGEINVSADAARTRTGRLRAGKTAAWQEQRNMTTVELEDLFPQSLARPLMENMSPQAFGEYGAIARESAYRQMRLRELRARAARDADLNDPDLFGSSIVDRIHQYGSSEPERFVDERIRASQIIGDEAEKAADSGDFARAARLAKLRIQYELGTPREKMNMQFGQVWRTDVPRAPRVREGDWRFRTEPTHSADYLRQRAEYLRSNFRHFNRLKRAKKLRDYPR